MSKNATHAELKAVREYDRGKFDDGIKDEESRGQKWDSTARQDISTVGRQSEYGLVSNTGPLGESFGLDWERDMMGSVGDLLEFGWAQSGKRRNCVDSITEEYVLTSIYIYVSLLSGFSAFP